MVAVTEGGSHSRVATASLLSGGVCVVTVSVIKADIGGYVGHSASHPDILDLGREEMEKAKQRGLLVDHHVSNCGDDMFLIMTHERGENNEEVHKLAWDTFQKGTELARKLKLYGAGQDLIADAFSGKPRGTGEVGAVSSTDKLSLIAGRYVGKDDPAMVVRAQGNFPAVGEVLEPFTTPFLVEGWMRGSHPGPAPPVGLRDA